MIAVLYVLLILLMLYARSRRWHRWALIQAERDPWIEAMRELNQAYRGLATSIGQGLIPVMREFARSWEKPQHQIRLKG